MAAVRYTYLKLGVPACWADIDATTAVLGDCPVSLNKNAESDASQRAVDDPAISTTCMLLSFAAWLALSGAEAEGREVEIVSETFASEAALA